MGRIFVLVLMSFAIAACAAGFSLDPVTVSPTGISFEYSYSSESEYPAALKAAEAHCVTYQKHAQPVGSPVRLGPDRAVASFSCIGG